MLSKEQLDKYRALNPWKSIFTVVFDWFLIFCTFYVAVYFDNPFVYVISVIFIARCQHALFMLMHEASHFILHPSNKVNDFIGQFLIAGPAFFSLSAYRRTHLAHHNTPIDGKSPYPMPRVQLAYSLLKDVLGISYFVIVTRVLTRPVRRKRFPAGKETSTGNQPAGGISRRYSSLKVALSIVLGNSFLLCVFFILGKLYAYFILWPLPILTVLMVFFHIRGITEHGGFYEYTGAMDCTRTIVNPVQCFFLHPHASNYHIEHHIYPAIPFHNLKKVHDVVKNNERYNRENLYFGYFKLLHGRLSY